jgi:hypothetical protein
LILDWLLDRMAQRTDRLAVIEASVCSYATLIDGVSRWAKALADRGIAGRVVSLEAEYGIEAIPVKIRFSDALHSARYKQQHGITANAEKATP